MFVSSECLMINMMQKCGDCNETCLINCVRSDMLILADLTVSVSPTVFF